MVNLTDLYTDGENYVLTNNDSNFIYEVLIFCRAHKYFCIIDREFYSTTQEIPNIVEHFYRDSNSEIVCTLLSAPLPWLLDNNYIKYVKPDKKTVTKISKKNVKSKTTISKQRSWEFNG